MCCTQAQLDEIAAQKPAYIILDEFHRAGAECWGESTVDLLKLCPDAKLLGLTATNIHYLDNNRDKQRNDFFVPQYVRHFLENDPIPSIEDSYQTYKMLVPQMPVEAVNQVFQQFTCSVDTNFVLLAMFPEKEGVTIPTSDDMKKAVEAAKKAELTPYVDNVKNEPLVPNLPEPKALPEAKDADFGYKVWNLDNGARVFFKQTDIDDSQVLFSASSFGGKNKTSDADIANVKAFDFVVNSCGVGNFTHPLASR